MHLVHALELVVPRKYGVSQVSQCSYIYFWSLWKQEQGCLDFYFEINYFIQQAHIKLIKGGKKKFYIVTKYYIKKTSCCFEHFLRIIW